MRMSAIALRITVVVTAIFASAPVLAASAGEVAHLSGTLSAQRSNGSILVLGVKSGVEEGDVLTTQRDSYAQINFADGSSVLMRPLSQLRVEAFSFTQDKPQADNLFMRLLKGGLRTVTGLVGKRGNQDAYRIGTPVASIGIRGSIGETAHCDPNCEGVFPGGGNLPPGTSHQTLSGTFVMTVGNQTQNIVEGNWATSNGGAITLNTGSIPGVTFLVPVGGTGLQGQVCR